MFERFTNQARRVVVLAQEEARMLDHGYIGTEHLLLGLLHQGTGTAAAIPGVEVAGKTGTAELGGSSCSGSSSETGSSTEGSSGGEGCAAQEHQNTDAWFAAFAPAHRPRLVVAVMLVRDGYGGETAAPVAREVMEAGLEDKG